MPLRVRIRTILRTVLFFTAIKIISDQNAREWGWLNRKDNLENEFYDYYAIRVHSAYLKDKGDLSERLIGFVTLNDFEIGPHIEMFQTQHLRNLIERIGGKYRKIVLNLDPSKISKSQTTLSSLFLRVLASENQSRLDKGLSKIEVYYYVSQ